MSDDDKKNSDIAEKLEQELKEQQAAAEIKIAPRRRFNRRAGDNDGGSASTWLISFTDVMALMLTFFVLLFSMASPDEGKWDKLTQTAQESFNRFYGKPLHRGSEDAVNIDKINFSRALNLNYLKSIMAKLVKEEPILNDIRLISFDQRLIISLPQNLLFDSGQAEVKERGRKALFALSGTLSRIKNRLEVVGHTDPRPVTGGEFKSNWELSLARAANVAAVLETVGYTKPVKIRGHASARYYDLPLTLSEESRLDMSRRVDIVVMEDDGDRLRIFDLGLPRLP